MVSFYFAISLSLGLILAAGPFPSMQDHPFCYLDHSCGPDSPYWPEACQKGLHQSPIDLPYKSKKMFQDNPKALNFNDGYSSQQFFIKNNGHTVQVSFTTNFTSNAKVSGYGFDVPYIFGQAHFHWGENTSVGSEHTINGVHLPMEVHLVHYSSNYPNYIAAASSDDPKALVVIGIFLIPLGESDINQPFDMVASNLPLNFTEQPLLINDTLDLNHFLPRGGESFYRYNGSLTTPMCNEEVIWSVIHKPIPIRPSNYLNFHEINDEEGNLMERNFRPTMPLDGRNIEFLNIQK